MMETSPGDGKLKPSWWVGTQMVTNIREVRTGSWVGTFPNSIPEDSTKIGIMRVCILNLILEMRLHSLL